MNFCVLTGRATRDAELKVSKQSGRQYCMFRLAVDGGYRGRDLPRETDFLTCLAFAKLGEYIARTLKKGMKIVIVGKIKEYEREDEYGFKRHDTTIIVREADVLDRIVPRDPVEDLMDGNGEVLIPKEITQSVLKQIDTTDIDMPEEFIGRIE